MILREPHLGRPYVARIMGKEDKQRPLKPIYDKLMQGVDRHAVVLGPAVSVWPVPSSGGRIVAAAHFELFTPDQTQRYDDTVRFFGEGTSLKERLEVLHKYHVSYILLDPAHVESDAFAGLLEESAVVRRVAGLVLMDAGMWRSSR
jgi:hypothetical protein